MDYLQYLYVQYLEEMEDSVLNLVINGLPSILNQTVHLVLIFVVLNLVINGLPSIHIKSIQENSKHINSFKPCYKWITFNT